MPTGLWRYLIELAHLCFPPSLLTFSSVSWFCLRHFLMVIFDFSFLHSHVSFLCDSSFVTFLHSEQKEVLHMCLILPHLCAKS